jgi:hypothetical protein
MKTALFGVLWIAAHVAQAGAIDVAYSGVVVDAINAPPEQGIGTRIHGRLSIAEAAAPADLFPDDPNYGLYASTPFGPRAVDFVMGGRPHAGESNDYVLVQNDPPGGDSYSIADRSARETPDAFTEFLQVAAPGLFDGDGLRQSIVVTADDHPSAFFGILESGIGSTYRYVQFALERISIKPHSCHA